MTKNDDVQACMMTYNGPNNNNLKVIYNKYTDHIINYEKHIHNIFRDWVIDINHRNYILQKLDSMVRSMFKIYNKNLSQETQVSSYNNCDTNKSCIVKISDQVRNGFRLLDIIDQNKNQNSTQPFHEIKKELLKLTSENGCRDLDEFFRLYLDDGYLQLIDSSILDLYRMYNKIFIPLGYHAEQIDNKIELFKITKKNSKCDGLIENTCFLEIYIPLTKTRFIFEGYVSADVLNVYVRSSQIYSEYLFDIRIKSRKIIEKNEIIQIDDAFLTRYYKFINSNYFFVSSAQEFAEKTIADYQLFRDISTKNFNLVMKKFVSCDVKTMYNYINLLLMGNDQNIGTATILFNLLKDKRVSGETLSDIIYHNLSYYSQIKLKKAVSFIKNELDRIKALSPENISTEKKLAGMVNMPDNVKMYIMEKINEIKSGENNYKLQMAINGLMQFPWKPQDSRNDYQDIRVSMSKSRKYLQNVAKKLDETVYGHENSKKVLIELVGKWIQNPESTGQVIGLVGPPGIGKTLLAKSISTSLGIPLSIVGLGGMNDSADLIGHSFTYAGAQYGMIIRQMIKAGNWRCVMFFDEVDKVSKRNETNEIYNTLIHITDPNMNQHFQDRFYSSSVEFDLSGVLIVFSYNDSSKLDPILLDRIKEIKISPYSVQEKINIAKNYVLQELCENIGFDWKKIYFEDATIRYIIEKYTLEAGVRDLRRKIEQILLKFNIDRFYMRGPFHEITRAICKSQNTGLDVLDFEDYKNKELVNPKHDITSSPNSFDSGKSFRTSGNGIDTGSGLESYLEYKKSRYEECLDEKTLNGIFNMDTIDPIVITRELVHRYLEKPTMMVESVHHYDTIGVINGLYATTNGMGGILPIQVFKNYVGNCDSGSNRDSGSCDGEFMNLKMTGNQKKVMKESITCAFTCAVNVLNNSYKERLTTAFSKGFHIHVPDGGTPKDGPSAGCAFTTAFVSVLIGKKINHLVSMTGEIELTGKVGKIGGLDAKLAGARKAGVKYVYICQENHEDYLKIRSKNPEMFDDDFQVLVIEHILDILTDPNIIIGIQDTDFDTDVLTSYRKAVQSKKIEHKKN